MIYHRKVNKIFRQIQVIAIFSIVLFEFLSNPKDLQILNILDIATPT